MLDVKIIGGYIGKIIIIIACKEIIKARDFFFAQVQCIV